MKNDNLDLTGQRFGRWLVLEKANSRKRSSGSAAFWLCKCDCGTVREVSANSLRLGRTMSCGCYAKEERKTRMTTHGQTNERLYRLYKGVKARCYRPTASKYQQYGGRGIVMCDEWKDDYMSFFTWAMNNGYKPGLSLDRIDNNLGYYPDNCRWVTRKEQSNNRRNTVYITYNNETRPLTEWSDLLGISRHKLYGRIIRHNWDVEKAFTTP